MMAYKSINEIPVPQTPQIAVDTKAEVVLLPIYGIMIPFHITTIKSVTSNQDSEHALIRVSFNFS